MSLAIIIPYYKKTFFYETMESIASQTCKDFVLYIGDDASNTNPQDIIDEYKDKIKIVYHRFEENLGGKDLVAQWERCIDLTNGEEWLWLFSDDDTMDDGCVKEFYDVIDSNNSVQLLRFSKKYRNIVTGESWYSDYKKGICTVSDFLPDVLDMTQNHVTMPEFAYRRSLYEKLGIVKLPLAWGSDKATYLEFVCDAGSLYNMETVVNYRFSDENISAKEDAAIFKEKVYADQLYEKHLVVIFRNISKMYPQIDLSEMLDKRVTRYKSLPFSIRIFIVRNLLHMVKSSKEIKNIVKIILG